MLIHEITACQKFICVGQLHLRRQWPYDPSAIFYSCVAPFIPTDTLHRSSCCCVAAFGPDDALHTSLQPSSLLMRCSVRPCCCVADFLFLRCSLCPYCCVAEFGPVVAFQTLSLLMLCSLCPCCGVRPS